VYHDSFSGVLKNAVDHLGAEQLAEKAFGLVSHGGHRTTQAVAHLQIVVRSVHGVPISTQLCTEESDFIIDAAGRVQDVRSPEMSSRVDRFARELTKWARLLRSIRGDANASAQ
jgi:FMN reductase